MLNIHIILPRRERVGFNSSGAVALVVKELFEKSIFNRNIKIWVGPQIENQYILPIEIIPNLFLSYINTNAYYAKQISKKIIDSPQTYIEIHNRTYILFTLKEILKKSRFALYLHNDPIGMGGLETSIKREKVLELADAVICVSNFVRNRFLDGVNHFHEKCIVIHNSLDMSLYRPPLEAENYITFVGRMIKEKGALELAHALVDILPKYKKWSAVFIGGKNSSHSSFLSSYERSIKSVLKKVDNQIIWSGILPNHIVQNYLKKSKIAVIPSIWLEAQSRFLVEAMANGCAVVTSGRGGISETIGECGLIVNPEKPLDIKSSLESLIDDPALLELKRKQAYNRALKLFDINDKIQNLDELRKKLLRI